VERAGDRVALDRAHAEIAAHVPAVRVEHPQRAGRVGEHDELRAERLDRVWPAVTEGVGQAEAVPAAGVPRRRRPDVDAANPIPVAHESSV
jgi:hypothetical protein